MGVIIVMVGSLQAPLWAQSYAESEQIEFATQWLQHRQYLSAAWAYENFISQFPHSLLLANAYIGAGESHFFMNDHHGAMAFYQFYESHFPHGKEIGLVLLREAQCLSLEGKTDEVIAKLKAAQPLSIPKPYVPKYYFTLAKALMDKGKLKEAGEDFEKVIEQKPNGTMTAVSYLFLANIFAKTGNDQEAERLYRHVLQSKDYARMQSASSLERNAP